MLDMVKGERDLNENDIRSLHKIILGTQYENPSINLSGNITGKKINVGSYKTMPNHVVTSTGETHYYATPEETPAKMTALVSWYNENVVSKEVNPVVLASLFHHKFVEIHPFDDGNGRMTRILTNFILMKFGYPISVIKNENKKSYYAALSQADIGEVLPFVELMSETINHSLDIYIKGINGEDINDPDDLDKEIELFRKEIGVKTKIKLTKEDADLDKIIFQTFNSIRFKLNKFIDMFESYSEDLTLSSPNRVINLKSKPNINFENFKNHSNITNNSLSSSIYQFTLKNHMYKIELSVSYKFVIIFKPYYLEIKIGNDTVIKYYDENVLDDEIITLLTNRLRDLMLNIKKQLK
jgi:Fic family protein